MCAQAKSTPSERLFSAAGYVWDRRCTLKPFKVNKMMVLHQFDKNMPSKNNNFKIQKNVIYI